MNYSPIITISFGSLLFTSILFTSCHQPEPLASSCDISSKIALEYTDTEGRQIRVFENGEAYYVKQGECNFADQFFEPGFYSKHYIETDSGTLLIAGENQYFRPFASFIEDFDSYSEAIDLFITDINERGKLFSAFTLQSPSTKTVEDYISLRNCILNSSCEFIDNRFDLVPDPSDPSNQVLRFFSVAPSADMVTAKSSISSTLVLFKQGDDFWFEARYFIEDVLPTTIADFESSFFEGSPGPRLIFKGNHLAVENKFNEKITYKQPLNNEVVFPLNQWVKVKIHLKYGLEEGIIQVWQDDQLIINELGQNMPLDIWIQDRIEVGLSATNYEGVLYLDDMRFSHNAF